MPLLQPLVLLGSAGLDALESLASDATLGGLGLLPHVLDDDSSS